MTEPVKEIAVEPPGDSVTLGATVSHDTDAAGETVAAPNTREASISAVTTHLTFADYLGSWKARWGINRMDYRVAPGLYAVGRPSPESPVLLSANYKLSFDRLRSQLTGRDAWILVLDTDGINVWCAAGKGTFGADEIVRRAEAVGLANVVSGRTLVAPQLAATGVSAHEVRRRTGFRVVYGPVRAEDLPAFLDAGMKATPEMRRVRFPFRDRVVLIPVELMGSLKYLLILAAALIVLSGLGPDVYSVGRAATNGLRSAALLVGAYIAGVGLTPMLLPWLPGRSFAAKGAWAGVLFALAAGGYAWTHSGLFANALSQVAWLFMIVAVASFLGMNFTGSSTYTSLSGVKYEMRVAVPLQVVGAVLGLAMWLVALFI